MLKKVFFYALCALGMTGKVAAQTSAPSKLRIGVKTGLSLSSFTKDVSVFDKEGWGTYANDGYKKYFRIASLLGVTAQYPVTSSFSLGAELQYAGRGAAWRQENGSVAVIGSQGAGKAYNYYKFKINYLELPLTAHLNLSAHSAGTTSFLIYGGLAPAFSVNRSTSYHSYASSGSSPVADRTTTNGELKHVAPFNLSTVAGFEIASKKQPGVFFTTRISNTLLPVFRYRTSPEGYNLKTGMWTFTAGIGVYMDN